MTLLRTSWAEGGSVEFVVRTQQCGAGGVATWIPIAPSERAEIHVLLDTDKTES